MKRSRDWPAGGWKVFVCIYQVHFKLCGDMELEIEGFYLAKVGLT